MIDVVLPAYNEEEHLRDNAGRLYDYLTGNIEGEWRLIIADNGSTDGTLGIARALSREYERVTCSSMLEKGRGRALRKALSESEAEVLVYMDVDLSTDLKDLNALISEVRGGSAVATGSRLISGSDVKRRFVRDLLSKSYNRLARIITRSGVNDLQCGFKAFNVREVGKILPEVEDNNWFFDTELLVKAERMGLKVSEIPVRWVESEKSSVNVRRIITYYIRNLWRIRA
ncbi:MAG: dolichyl-phosphate beta-glucosyltransferase [Candidatus Altiarchaeota archaeon]